jgi:hypothetical protein
MQSLVEATVHAGASPVVPGLRRFPDYAPVDPGRASVDPDRAPAEPGTIPAEPHELLCFLGVIPVVPGRAKDETGYILSQITPDHPGDIKYFILSGVECRMFLDHPERCGQVVPGRIPGRSRITPDVYRGLTGCK